MQDNLIALCFALIALATRMIDYLKDKWDTVHGKTEKVKTV